MKPKEITRQEYWDIRNALHKKAVQLRKIHPRREDLNLRFWFSDSLKTCSYNERRWNAKFFVKPNVSLLNHFLPFPCDCRENAVIGKNAAICVCKHGNKYYLTTHKIGFCPWKE